MGGHQLDRIGAGERRCSCEHLIKDDAKRVDVRRRGRRAARAPLGSDIGGAADERAGCGEPVVFGAERDPEVDELHALLPEDDVAWLDVPVEDAGLVRGVQAFGDLRRDFRRVRSRYPARAGEQSLERLAADEFHHGEGTAVVFPVVVDAAETGVSKPCEHASLTAESCPRVRITVDLQHEHLDGDLAAKHRVYGAPYGPHPAAPNGLAETVSATKDGGRRPGHATSPPMHGSAPSRSEVMTSDPTALHIENRDPRWPGPPADPRCGYSGPAVVRCANVCCAGSGNVRPPE